MDLAPGAFFGDDVKEVVLFKPNGALNGWQFNSNDKYDFTTADIEVLIERVEGCILD